MSYNQAVPSLADFDESIYSDTKEDNIKRAISLISKIPTIVSAWNRIRMGLDVIEADRGTYTFCKFSLYGIWTETYF